MRRFFGMVLLRFVIAVGMGGSAHADHMNRPQSVTLGFDVQAGIELNYFASHPAGDGGPIVASPDGSMFAFITTRNYLRDNTAESTLWLVQRGSVTALQKSRSESTETVTALRPRPLVKVRAIPSRKSYEPHGPVISSVQWSSDSTRLYFLAERSDGTRSLRDINVRTFRSRALSRSSQDVTHFALGPSGEVYSAVPRPTEIACKSSGTTHFIVDQSLSDVLFPCDYSAFASRLSHETIWHHAAKGSPHFSAITNSPGEPPQKANDADIFSLSPNGQFVVRTTPASVLAEHWLSYSAVVGHDDLLVSASPQNAISAGNRWRLRQYRITSLVTGKSIPLLDEFLGDAIGDGDSIRVSWSSDSSRLLITNITMPINRDKGIDSAHPVCAVASVEIPSLAVACIVRSAYVFSSVPSTERAPAFHVDTTEFGNSRNTASIHITRQTGVHDTLSFTFTSGVWKSTQVQSDSAPDSISMPHTTTLEVRQNANTLPALWAVDNATGRASQVWDPNPRWKHYPFGRAAISQWTDGSNYLWRGMLLSPEHVEEGHLYPLIIQTHGISPGKFLVDGQYPTAEAARALSHAGFFVLQMPYRPDHVGTPQEASDQLAGFRSAIDYIASHYPVNRSKVGIVGFSRTGFHVEEAIIHAPDIFAAAVIADGTDTSYMPYRLFSHTDTAVSKDVERLIGAKPFGPGLQVWQQRASGFHLDQVKAPVLVQALGPASLLLEWELYSTLGEHGTSTKLLFIPDGQHVLRKPKHIYASQEATVDWFRHLLQN